MTSNETTTKINSSFRALTPGGTARSPVYFLSAMAAENDDLVLECSDEEMYQGIGDITKDGGRVDWRPFPSRIAELYEQIEKSGNLELKWTNPGRRSPSIHSSSQNSEVKTSTESEKTNDILTEFDFDEEFNDSPSGKIQLSAPRKKSVTSGSTKKVAKLDKVIGDMKRYQIIDQQKSDATPAQIPIPLQTEVVEQPTPIS